MSGARRRVCSLLCRVCAWVAAAWRDPIPDRPPVELPLFTTAPGGRSVPPAGDLIEEVKALAELLADVVELAADTAVFPSRLEVVAELALEHHSVRQALRALRTEEITS